MKNLIAFIFIIMFIVSCGKPTPSPQDETAFLNLVNDALKENNLDGTVEVKYSGESLFDNTYFPFDVFVNLDDYAKLTKQEQKRIFDIIADVHIYRGSYDIGGDITIISQGNTYTFDDMYDSSTSSFSPSTSSSSSDSSSTSTCDQLWENLETAYKISGMKDSDLTNAVMKEMVKAGCPAR